MPEAMLNSWKPYLSLVGCRFFGAFDLGLRFRVFGVQDLGFIGLRALFPGVSWLSQI